MHIRDSPWTIALEEKHKRLGTMLEAMYIDVASWRSIVGTDPKARFKSLFDSLKRIPGNKATIFGVGEVEERETGPVLWWSPTVGKWKTGESRSPSYQCVLRLLSSRGALGVDFLAQERRT
jgi:hypothetical protein